MFRIRILYASHQLVCALFMAVLLPVGVAGQSLSKQALRNINRQLSGQIEDTTRVRLLLAVSAHLTAYVDRSTARDSALQFAKAASAWSTKLNYDSGIYKSYLQKINVWAQVHNHAYAQYKDDTVALENARAVEREFIAFVQKRGSADQLGEAYADVAGPYDVAGGDPAESVRLYDSAAVYFRKSGNVLREARALYEIGLNYNALGKLKESLPFYHGSITLAEPMGGMLLYSAYSLLGRTYSDLGGYTIALKYQLKALQLAEAAGDTTDEMGAIHLFLGLTHSALRNYPLALEHYEKAYRIDRHYTAHHPSEFFAAAMNLATAKARENPREAIDFLKQFREEYKDIITSRRAVSISYELMDSYVSMRDYATAQTYCNELMAVVETTPGALLGYVKIARFLVLSGQYASAEKYLVNAAQISRARGRISYLRTIYSLWYKVDSAKGDYASALEKFKLHKTYGDSMLTDSKAKEIALLEVEYETQKKEQSITLLTKDSELARQQLAQSRFQKNGIMAGLAVAVLISGLLYNQYRIKKKSNTELTRRQQEIQSTNAVLQKTILEKEWLLKEVHHRVKNNLQTVVSLLESQSYVLQNSEAVSAIHDSQNRVHAMSLIHQKLYLTEPRTSINMAVYLSELTEYLRDSFSAGRQIQFQLSIQPIELDVSQAIPIGLIFNEAITNAIKYAFPSESKENCRVVISMQQDSARNMLLTIADNGRGLPPDFDGSNSRIGMGLKLMYGLTSEIDGHCKICSNNDTGVSIEVTFNGNVKLE